MVKTWRVPERPLLRALLPSAKKLPSFTWRRDFQACFRERQAPYLMALDVCLGDDVAGFSYDVREAAPVLERLSIKGPEQTPLGATALRSVSAALRNGALTFFEEVDLRKCTLGDRDIRDFADALEESGCATRLVNLIFVSRGVGVDGIRIMADLICRGIFPALKCLDLPENPNISDVGVVALAEVLMKSTQPCLESLGLKKVGMGDEGIAALASLISQGRLEHLTWLDISGTLH